MVLIRIYIFGCCERMIFTVFYDLVIVFFFINRVHKKTLRSIMKRVHGNSMAEVKMDERSQFVTRRE